MEPRPALRIPGLWTGTGVVMLVLLSLRRSLRLPSNYGIEDYIGWNQPAVIEAARAVWCSGDQGVWVAATAYLLVDTGLFIGFYGVLLMTLYRSALDLIKERASSYCDALCLALKWLAPALLAVLVANDLVENYGGIRRLGAPTVLFWISCAAGALTASSVWVLARPASLRGRKRARIGLAMSIGLVALALLPAYWSKSPCCLASFGSVGSEQCLGGRIFAAQLGAPFGWASDYKLWLALIAILPLLLAYLTWWSSAGIGGRNENDIQDDARIRHAVIRSGIRAVIWRSRYVLLVLLFFAAMLLAMDQSRDLMLGLADWSRGESLSWRLLVFLAGGLGIVMLSYSCWLWTRLAAMIERPGLIWTQDETVNKPVSQFARSWARLLATVPLVIICLLVAFSIGDVTFAARRAQNGSLVWLASLVTLATFALLTVLAGVALVFVRRRYALPEVSNYFNSVDDPRKLVSQGAAIVRESASGKADGETSADTPPPGGDGGTPVKRFGRWIRNSIRMLVHRATRPMILPVVALILMLALRAATLLAPDIAATVPSGLAIMTLALVWWLGVLGALSLFEQKHGFLYVLVPLGLAGGLLWTRWAIENHRLDGNQPPGSIPSQELLSALQRDGLLAIVLLASACVLIWFIALIPAATLTTPPLLRKASRWPGTLRWIIVLAAFSAVLVVLHKLDSRALELAAKADPGSTSAASTRQDREPSSEAVSIQQAHADSVVDTMDAPLADEPPPEIVLIAAEGGGARSAYWTAKALAELYRVIPDFESQVFLLSGVSGGSIGIAVFRGCILKMQRPEPAPSAPNPHPDPYTQLRKCVDETMSTVDALTPLLGGMLFEDLIVRLLPTGAICSLPGCGHLSRALLFERAWLRVLPELAAPMSLLSRSGPQLAFNSTWVESGNRTVASTFPFSQSMLPSATNLRDCLRIDLSLITAAHTSARFPYINPLAIAEPFGFDDAGGCKKTGYLIDGGYFDNSGAATLMDVVRLLQSVTPERKIRVFLIRNGQSGPECIVSRRTNDEPPPGCFKLIDMPRTYLDSLINPLDRRRLDYLADALGPLVALYNVSGTDSHGRHAPAQLSSMMIAQRRLFHAAPATATTQGAETQGAPRKVADCPPVVLIEQIDDGELVPLGWYLSGPASLSLDNQIKRVFESECLSREGLRES